MKIKHMKKKLRIHIQVWVLEILSHVVSFRQQFSLSLCFPGNIGMKQSNSGDCLTRCGINTFSASLDLALPRKLERHTSDYFFDRHSGRISRCKSFILCMGGLWPLTWELELKKQEQSLTAVSGVPSHMLSGCMTKMLFSVMPPSHVIWTLAIMSTMNVPTS